MMVDVDFNCHRHDDDDCVGLKKDGDLIILIFKKQRNHQN